MFPKMNGYAEWLKSFPSMLNHDIEVTSHLASAQTDSAENYGHVANTVLLQKTKDKLVREQFYQGVCIFLW